MAGSISRRDIIKRSAIAGAAAWTAPMLLQGSASAATVTACPRVHVTPGGSINLSTVPHCADFGDTTADFTSCVVDFVAPGDFSPKFWGFQICGALATNLSGIAVNVAANSGPGCTANPWGGAACVQAYGPTGAILVPPSSIPASPVAFNDAEIDMLQYTIVQANGPTCGNAGAFGPTIQMSPIGQAFTDPELSGLGDPGANCRWVIIDTTPNVVDIGLIACFTSTSVAPPC